MTKTDFTGEIIFTEPGSMAPIWKNMLEAGKTQVEDRLGWNGEITELFQILFCVLWFQTLDGCFVMSSRKITALYHKET